MEKERIKKGRMCYSNFQIWKFTIAFFFSKKNHFESFAGEVKMLKIAKFNYISSLKALLEMLQKLTHNR